MAQNEKDMHKNHRKRVRNRFLQTKFEGFAEHEILELLLFYAIPRCDTNPIAHRLLDAYKTLANVLDADPASLAKIPGMGENSAVLLSMIPSLCQAYEISKRTKGSLLEDVTASGQYAVTMFKDATVEKFGLICLDSHRRVHWSGIIATGTIDRIDAYPRLVLNEILRHNATRVIFTHNHPHGSLVPSESDKSATRMLTETLRALDIRVLDHIIVSNDRYYSMAEAGFIF